VQATLHDVGKTDPKPTVVNTEAGK